MRNLLRKPLPWVVLAECAVVASLVMVAWHLVASAPVAGLPPMAVSPPVEAGEGREPPAPAASKAKPRASRLPPGLNVNASFWRSRLAELNRGEAEFELLEWRLVRSAMDAARRYLESVVLPLVKLAER